MSQSGSLSRLERLALGLARVSNKPLGKRLQYRFHRHLNRQWVRWTIGRRVFVDNADWLVDLEPDRGVMIAANHRSFFDQYANMLVLYERGATWPQKIYFPVRSNFFYEQPSGVLLNLAISAMTMYPPIFRDPAKAHLNKLAIDEVGELLAEPGVLVGIHPEGTRGKGPDPYELLPAQPGVGQMVMTGKPILVPLFINGLGNSFAQAITDSYKPDAKADPIIAVYGDPLDVSEYLAQKPRASVYLKLAKHIRNAIIDLIPREKEIRAACAAGDIQPDHPGWLFSRGRNHAV